MVKRAFAQSVIVVGVAFLAGAVVLVLTSHNPVMVYRELVERTLLRRAGIEESLIAMCPVLLAALAAWIASRVGMWNIGIDGQIVAGAVVAGALAPVLDPWPAWAMWIACVVAGMIAGAVWALIPAMLRVRSGVNEIVTTIMMTYVAYSAASWLIKGALKDPDLVSPATPVVDVARRIPDLPGTRVHSAVLVAVVLCLAVWVVSRWTSIGVLSQVAGDAPRAAHLIGVPVERYILAGFLLSGSVAALAGVSEVVAVRGSVQADWRPEFGLAAFAVLFLARRNVAALLPAALLLGMMSYGSTVLPRTTDVAPAFFPFLEGLILVFLAVGHWTPWRRSRRSSIEGEARA